MDNEICVSGQSDPAKRSFLEVAQEWASLALRIDALERACAGRNAHGDEIATSVAAWRADCCRQMEDLQTDLRRVDRSLCDLHGRVDALLEQSDREDLHDRQLATLTDQHFESQVLEPLIRRLVPVIDLIDSTAADENASGRHPQSLAAVLTQVLDLLAVYGVEPTEVASGDSFIARTMRAGRTLPAPNSSATGTVATTLRRGFSKGERVLRPPVVAVYGEPQHTDNKENHDDTHDRP